MKERIVSVLIDSLNEEGAGEGTFLDGAGHEKRVSIPFTCPGDEVEAILLRGRRGHFEGRLKEIKSPSKTRIVPKCVHFGTCGGCRLQHLPYEGQLAYKEELIKKYFASMDSAFQAPILKAENPYYYRNKMEFSFHQDWEENRFLGLFQVGKKGRVLNLTECHLVSPWFITSLQKVLHFSKERELTAYNPRHDSGSLRTLTLRESITTQQRLVMLTVSGRPEYALKKSDLEAFKALFAHEDTSVFLRIHQAIKGKPTEFFEMHLGGRETIEELLDIDLSPLGKTRLTVKISPQAFFQPNTMQAMQLYSIALKMAELKKEDVLFDLYCGTGTLGLIASPFVSQVIGVEISPEACLDARENARLNGCDNVEIFCGPVSELLKSKEKFPSPSIILLDPPRQGLDALAIQEIVDLSPERIIYISCNPKTQARDVLLLSSLGYKLMKLQPVDQFPETPHIENVALLCRSSFPSGE